MFTRAGQHYELSAALPILAKNRLPASAPPVPGMGLETLFRQYYGSIWRLLRRLGIPTNDVDDAAQEVFWIAARKLTNIRPGKEHSFLYGIALRVASNQRRRQASLPPLCSVDQIAPLQDSTPSPEEEVGQEQTRALLDRVLGQMSTDLRTVFVLQELEGLEVKAIAELEGLPIGTASSRLRRAREQFKLLAMRVQAQIQRQEGEQKCR